MLGIILMVVLILLLLGALPSWRLAQLGSQPKLGLLPQWRVGVGVANRRRADARGADLNLVLEWA